jgi:hypothetical protein
MIQRSQLSPPTIAAIAAISVVVLFIAWYQPRARPEIAPSSAVGSPWVLAQPEGGVAPGAATPTPAALTGDFTQAPITGGLSIFSDEGLFDSGDKERLAAELDRALSYVVARFGTSPRAQIDAYIGWEPGCGLHGIAYTSERTTQVFTCPDLPRARAVNIMAHEFVHQLAHDRYGDAHLAADMILLEGVATWGAGDYWLAGERSFGSMVRPWVQAGTALPLATSYIGRPIGDMNTLYYEWGSFVEFLVDVYGRDTFDALYISGDGTQLPGASDYVGVYGKDLGQLEQEWRAWVLTQ